MAAEDKQAEEPKHALCSASGAHRWLECPGSVGLSLTLPVPPPSEYAVEGTRAHALAEEALNAFVTNGTASALLALELKRNEYLDTHDGLGTMIDHVLTYVHVCIEQSELFDKQPKSAMKVEAKLALNQALAMYGTADFVMTGKVKGVPTGLIVDLKYGKGIEVESDGNPQLAYYAAALTKMSSQRLESVKVVIVQPRVDRWQHEITYSREELETWYGVLTRGAEKALQQAMLKKYEYKAGNHCRFCPAKGVCETHSAWLNETAGLDFADKENLPSVNVLTPERMSRILKAKNDVKRFIESVEESAMAMMLAGKTVPGFKLVRSITRRRWKHADSITAEALEREGIEPWERTLKSPAAIEKEKKFGAFEQLVIKPEGVPTLAPVEDRRAEISMNDFEDETI